MGLADYAHHNEDAMHMWWHEEGKHQPEEPDYDPYEDNLGYDDDYDEDEDSLEQQQFDATLPHQMGPTDPDWDSDMHEDPFPAEDAHLEAAYEDRFGAEDVTENDY